MVKAVVSPPRGYFALLRRGCLASFIFFSGWPRLGLGDACVRLKWGKNNQRIDSAVVHGRSRVRRARWRQITSDQISTTEENHTFRTPLSVLHSSSDCTRNTHASVRPYSNFHTCSHWVAHLTAVGSHDTRSKRNRETGNCAQPGL